MQRFILSLFFTLIVQLSYSQMTFDSSKTKINGTYFNEVSPRLIKNSFIGITESDFYDEMDKRYLNELKNDHYTFHFYNNELTYIGINNDNGNLNINGIQVGDDISEVLNSFENAEKDCSRSPCRVFLYDSENLDRYLIFTFDKYSQIILDIIYGTE
ncbi:MAG: hypothetical protein ACPGR7_05250 [Flavobacteriaceae bacterium]